MKNFEGQRGLSLVEVTIMLLVLMLLTGVLAPSIFDFVMDARWVKVKEDCEAIGVSVARVTRDVGPCLKFDAATPCNTSNRVDLLYSDGPAVTTADLGGEAAGNAFPAANLAQALNWSDWERRGDSMENQFVTNAGPRYPTVADRYAVTSPVGPLFGLGWRGAYLAPPIGPDPWGSKYVVNSAFLSVAVNAGTSGEGAAGRWWERDTFCISPGPNRTYDTYIGGTLSTGYYGTNRQLDDFVYIVQGSGR
jgi:hypothetical protein